MRKVIITLLAVAMVLCMYGCEQKEETPITLNTDLGTFTVARLSFQETYGDSLVAGDGNLLYIVALTAAQAFDETQFHSYFIPETASQVARVIVDGHEYLCQITAVQGPENGDTVEYALVFSVPASVKEAKVISLKVQNQDAVILKDDNAQ